MEYRHLLDTRGLLCPEPVMMLHSTIDDMAVRDVVLVLATDPSTQRDIPKFCNFLGHELLAQEVTEQEFRYFIRKS
jgi:tRNA 2-thiouridine synthesizing protein A